jgi:hypothetical protein
MKQIGLWYIHQKLLLSDGQMVLGQERGEICHLVCAPIVKTLLQTLCEGCIRY